jgi:murein L,D-transpeptidase YafK
MGYGKGAMAVVWTMGLLLFLGLPGTSRGDDPCEPAETPAPVDKIVVIKSQRTMVLMKDGEVIKEYQVHLGQNPKGHKLRQGDRRTPEGYYFIDGRLPDSGFHLALHISYPDALDDLNARMSGVKPGGNILIHGLPNGITNKYRMLKDWTRGCIAVSNEEIEEIWNLVPNGTLIEIKP